MAVHDHIPYFAFSIIYTSTSITDVPRLMAHLPRDVVTVEHLTTLTLCVCPNICILFLSSVLIIVTAFSKRVPRVAYKGEVKSSLWQRLYSVFKLNFEHDWECCKKCSLRMSCGCLKKTTRSSEPQPTMTRILTKMINCTFDFRISYIFLNGITTSRNVYYAYTIHNTPFVCDD